MLSVLCFFSFLACGCFKENEQNLRELSGTESEVLCNVCTIKFDPNIIIQMRIIN